MTAIRLSRDPCSLEQVLAVACDGAVVEIDPDVLALVQGSRDAVDRHASAGHAIYGVTRGLGPKSSVTLAEDDVSVIQHRIVAGRAVSVGPPLPTEIVRAALFVRAAGIARGGSGASVRLLQTLVEALNENRIPAAPGVGSIGDSDLVVLAGCFGSLLPDSGLGPKDGLALISSNAVSIGQAALALGDVDRFLAQSLDAAALSFEAFQGSLEPLTARVAEVHPVPGQARAAAGLRSRLAGGRLEEPGVARRLQDPLSFRCAPQVLGAALAASESAAGIVAVELAAAADNPLVTADDELLHTGNFDALALALAFDGLALSLYHVVTLASARIARLLEARTSGLPLSLSPIGADRAGLVSLQKTAASAAAHVRHLANPASLDASTVSDGIEDHSSNAPLAVSQVADLVEKARLVLAIELMIAAQAIDLRERSGELGVGTAETFAWVRQRTAELGEDRALGPELQTIVDDLRG